MLSIKQSLGVTLIEILIALSIVVILTLLAVPAFTDFLREYRLTSAAQNMYQVLQYAQTEAIKRNQIVYVSFQTGDNWCYGVNAASTCTCSTPSSCSLGVRAAPQTQTLNLTTTGLTSTSLSFEPTRGAVGASAFLTFTNYGLTPTVSVKVTSLGNLSLCSSNVSGYPSCS